MDVRAIALALAVMLVACNRLPRDSSAREQAMALTGADPDGGPALMRHYGCVSCHTIPGVRGADATVGPPLTAMSRRTYIAGVLPNNPREHGSLDRERAVRRLAHGDAVPRRHGRRRSHDCCISLYAQMRTTGVRCFNNKIYGCFPKKY
jgi:hypothetical protein